MSDKAFVDTNILVYAYDQSNSAKREVACDLIETLWQQQTGVISTQVLQELYVNIRRQATHPISSEAAQQLLADYLAWEVIVNDSKAVLDAIDIESRYQISFWDALIIRAANVSRASVLYSEDLNHHQWYDAIQVINPFVE